jgi:hypothetical protein
MVSGEIIEHHQHTRHGDPDDPLTDDELNDKFTELTSHRIGQTAAQGLSLQIWQDSATLVTDLSKEWALKE